MCLAVPGRVESILSAGDFDARAKVSFGGIQKEVCTAFVPDVKPGDYVLVHAGFALSIVDEEEANRLLASLGDLSLEV